MRAGAGSPRAAPFAQLEPQGRGALGAAAPRRARPGFSPRFLQKPRGETKGEFR